jgi:hypothetical protein
MAAAQHPARIVQAVGADIGLQQRELHQVELCPATADTFEFAGDRLERIYHSRKILPLERSERARHRRNEGPRWITTVARELVDLPFTRLQRCLIAGYGLLAAEVGVSAHDGTGPSIWASIRAPYGPCMTSTPCAFTDPSAGPPVWAGYRTTPPAIVNGTTGSGRSTRTESWRSVNPASNVEHSFGERGGRRISKNLERPFLNC